MAMHSSILAWKIPWTEEPGRLQSWIFIGRTDAEAETPVVGLPDVKNWLIDGQGSLAYCHPWGHKELGMTEWLNWTELTS